MGFFSDILGTMANTFRIGKGTLNMSALTESRSLTVADRAGRVAVGPAWDLPSALPGSDTQVIIFNADGSTSYTSLTGTAFTSGSGAPSGGNDGDLYLDTNLGDIYQKSSGSWSVVFNVKGTDGDDGADGSQILTGAGTPVGSPSVSSAYWLNTINGDWYQWTGSDWGTPIANLTGPTGPAGADGGDKWFADAGAWKPRATNGPTPVDFESTTNKINLDAFDFDPATEQFLQIKVLWEAGWSTFTFQPHWTATSGSGDVVWKCKAVAISNDDAIDAAFGTAQTSTDTLTATGDLCIGPTSSAITPSGTPQTGDLVVIELSRDASAGGDTLGAAARLVSVYLEFA